MGICNDLWKGQDKQKHFLACFGIAIVCPILSLIVAIVKEIYDLNQVNNHFCWKDLVYDVIGIIFGTIIHIIILCLII